MATLTNTVFATNAATKQGRYLRFYLSELVTKVLSKHTFPNL
jgi:hypothetical protein